MTLFCTAAAAVAYPEFQTFAEKHSGRPTNCAMCHVSPDGPIGDGDGQIGSLSESEMARLNKARAALEPGQDVDSPILNEFGNHIIKALGKSKVLELRNDPAKLVEALGTKSDLDGDGIPDSLEYAEGTDPLNQFHGEPWRLFVNNLSREKVHVFLALAATVALVFGLSNFIRGINVLLERRLGGD
ncbi:MAG TPA: thrombospondin type 3 repeat-containing protein [Candidatus Obscuribacterales bacterium]